MAVRDKITDSQSKWMGGTGPENDVVISSRVRLARNITGLPFPHFMSEEEAAKIILAVKRAISNAEAAERVGSLEFIELNELTSVEHQILVEKHLVSLQLIEKPTNRAVILTPDESLSIMVNEEDHLRIQCLKPGFQLQETWSLANDIDDMLEQTLDLSYCEQRGYLTSCPTNVGTGMRASVMMHLPVLAMVNQVAKMVHTISQLGLVVRGYYGEGTEALGNFFQVSNQVTMGQTEEEIIKNLLTVTKQIVAQERAVREAVWKENKDVLEDRIYRTLGIMRYARMMTSQEALNSISDLRMGIALGVFGKLSYEQIDELVMLTRPAFLVKKAGGQLKPEARDCLRAQIIREKLAEIDIN